MSRLEVFNETKAEWYLMAEAKEGQKFQKKGETLILHWEHEGKKVQTVYNLNLFPAYSIV